jgi:hypothetical protein
MKLRRYRLLVLGRCQQTADNHISLSLSFRLLALQGLRPSIVDRDGVSPGSLRGGRENDRVVCTWSPHPFNPDQPEPHWARQVRELMEEQE